MLLNPLPVLTLLPPSQEQESCPCPLQATALGSMGTVPPGLRQHSRANYSGKVLVSWTEGMRAGELALSLASSSTEWARAVLESLYWWCGCLCRKLAGWPTHLLPRPDLELWVGPPHHLPIYELLLHDGANTAKLKLQSPWYRTIGYLRRVLVMIQY